MLKHFCINSILGRHRFKTQRTGQIRLHGLSLESFFIFRHVKHPKGWTSVQLLGCSSKAVGVLVSQLILHRLQCSDWNCH